MEIDETFGPDGTLLHSRVVDLAAGVYRITDHQAGTPEEVVPIPADDLAYYAERDAERARRQRLEQAAATLRQWAEDARGVNVAPMNTTQHKNVTQTLVDRLGVFFDRFADLLDER